jgi:MFS family permease
MNNPPAHGPHYKWELLAWLWFANFLNQGDRQIYNAVLPQIKADLGATDVQMGLVASLFGLAYGLMIPMAGWLGDSRSRKWIVCTSLLVFSVGTLCTGLASGLVALVIFRSVATGIGESFYTPSALTLIDEQHQKTRSLALSINQTALYVGIVTSSWLAAWICNAFGWRATFMTFGGFGLILCCILAIRLRDVPRFSASSGARADAPRIREMLDAIWTRPTILLLTVAFACLVFGCAGFATWMPTLLYEKYSLSLVRAAFHSVFLHYLLAFFGVMAGGWLADRLVARSTRIRLHIGVLGLFGCVPFVYAIGSTSDWLMVNVAMGAFGFFRGLYDSVLFASLYDVVPARYRSSVTGFMIACAYIVGAAAPLCLGLVKQCADLSVGMMLLAPVFLLGGVTLLVATGPRFDRDRVDQPAPGAGHP